MTDFPFIRISPNIPQIRLGLIGIPGAGKTTASLTFPNPVVVNYDRKLQAGVHEIPMYDPACSESFRNPTCPGVKGDDRTAFINFLKYYAPKLPPDTTLIIDSWTSIMNRLDEWHKANERAMFWSERKKEVDGFKVHADRISFGVEVTDACKTLPCHVIITMHEQREWDKEGNRTADIRPLMKGQFADQMPSHLTAFFRAQFRPDFAANAGYYWQVKSDSIFKVITPPGFTPNSDKIPATYEAYCKCFKS